MQTQEDRGVSSSENLWFSPEAPFESSERMPRQTGLAECWREGLVQSALPKKATKILTELPNQSFHNLEVHRRGEQTEKHLLEKKRTHEEEWVCDGVSGGYSHPAFPSSLEHSCGKTAASQTVKDVGLCGAR